MNNETPRNFSSSFCNFVSPSDRLNNRKLIEFRELCIYMQMSLQVTSREDLIRKQSLQSKSDVNLINLIQFSSMTGKEKGRMILMPPIAN